MKRPMQPFDVFESSYRLLTHSFSDLMHTLAKGEISDDCFTRAVRFAYQMDLIDADSLAILVSELELAQWLRGKSVPSENSKRKLVFEHIAERARIRSQRV